METTDTLNPQSSFKYTLLYIKELKSVAEKAWDSPQFLKEEDYQQVRQLCSLTKLEASTWYQSERIRKEQQKEISPYKLAKFLHLIRNEKLSYESEELNKISEELLNNNQKIREYRLRTINCPNSQKELAQKIFNMVKELSQIFNDDAAMLFYLETRITENAYKILKSSPLLYQKLIRDLAQLDKLKGCITSRVKELDDELNKYIKKYIPDTEKWWQGTKDEFDKFINLCIENKWIETDNESRAIYPYILSETCCCTNFYKEILCYSEEKGLIKRLIPTEERHSPDNSKISCKDLLKYIGNTFNAKLRQPLFSRIRNEMYGGNNAGFNTFDTQNKGKSTIKIKKNSRDKNMRTNKLRDKK